VWFLEAGNADLCCLHEFINGRCRLSLIASAKTFTSAAPRVCTRFVNLARRFVPEADVMELHGCNEIALPLGAADYVVDVVETGRTLEEMELEEVKVLTEIGYGLWSTRRLAQHCDRLLDSASQDGGDPNSYLVSE